MKSNNVILFLLLIVSFKYKLYSDDTIRYVSINGYIDSLYIPYLKCDFEERKEKVKNCFLDTTITRIYFSKSNNYITINPKFGIPSEYGLFIADIYSLADKESDNEFIWSDKWIFRFDTIQLFKNIDSLGINYKQQTQKYDDVGKRYDLSFLDVYFLNNIEGRIELYQKYYKKNR